jgi:perosamine synthetase
MSMLRAVPDAAPARIVPLMRPWLGAPEAAAASEAVLSGWVAQGPRVAEFEQAFARHAGGGHAVALSSGTSALHLALILAGIGPGADVVVPSLSFMATVNAVRHVGARPVFADVDPVTQTVTASTIGEVMTPSTRGVIVVDQAGIPADLDPILELCEPSGTSVVQDAACAVGASYRGRPVGAHAALSAFSFHPRNVITTGEGGMLVTPRDDWARRARRLRDHGMSVRAAERHADGGTAVEEYHEIGFNYRMTDMQAGVGVVQLGRLDQIVARRRLLAHRYRRLLSCVPELAGAVMAADPPYGTTNFQSFWVCLPEDIRVSRDELLGVLARYGISGRRGIMASHLEPAYAGHPHAPLPETERAARQSLILPLFHELTEADQDLVVEVIAAAVT